MNKSLLAAVACVSTVLPLSAQVTTSGITGHVVADGEEVYGATVLAIHQPTGARYGVMTDLNGRYSIAGMTPGGPYRISISYVGYQPVVFEGVELTLDGNFVANATLQSSQEVLEEVVVTASANSNMRSDRAGSVVSISSKAMTQFPTVTRSLNDVMRLNPTGVAVGESFAVGGGNYRQSAVTVDGAAFNNSFGIGGSLPANGSPISIDALEQISVSTTPFDVRQSGFTGGAINAVTKSGTNEHKGTAYMYTTNNHLRGNKIGDYTMDRTQAHKTTYGVTIGGPIIKNKLFFFVNGEYENQVSAGPIGVARASESDAWDLTGQVHRPTVGQMETIKQFLMNTYNYNPGRYQGYSLETPSYKVLARLDWIINDNNKVNIRFNTTSNQTSDMPSSSASPLSHGKIYPGGTASDGSGFVYGSGRYSSGRTTNTALYFESTRYMQKRDFTSVAGEWNAKFLDGKLSNMLRATYSFQDEPRTYVGGSFPTVDILQDGAVYTTFGPDPFTAGNLRQVKTFVVTDESSWHTGIHNLLAGVQYETNNAVNGFAPAGNGYYVFSSWSDFTSGNKPASFAITFNNALDGSFYKSEMSYNQVSAYVQDQINFSSNFRLTAGARFELPIYPSLKDNYNEPFAQLDFGGKKYTTDQVPGTSLIVSPRVGFNWDIAGDRNYVLRGGIGYFVGRVPFVWLVSSVVNSNCHQTTYMYNNASQATASMQPNFATNTADIISQLPQLTANITAPQSPTIIDKDFKNPGALKSSLAIDAKLPGGIDLTVENIYSREFNPTLLTNQSIYHQEGNTIRLSANDVRTYYTKYNVPSTVYVIQNAKGNKAYYDALTVSLKKDFDFGLSLAASWTGSISETYGDGLGDQVSSAYTTAQYCSVNGNNAEELGYGSFVAPNHVIATVSYRKPYKIGASAISFIYEGVNLGVDINNNYCARSSYLMTSNVVNDGGATNLIYVPASREELEAMNFSDYSGYTAAEQREDFWNYVNNDNYLKSRKGQYTERGGKVMPWHNQLDLRYLQDFAVKVGNHKNTLQLGVDIKNVLNLVNSDWGNYKTFNNLYLLKYVAGDGQNGSDGSFQFQKSGKDVLKKAFTDYKNITTCYSIQFSVRYIFE